MVEKHVINGKDVWVMVEAIPVQRSNPNIIPTEYFTATYYFQEPPATDGNRILDESGELKLFESPVAALSYVNKALMQKI